MLIHSIPVYTVCSCHNRMRSIRFIIVGAVVPHCIVAIVTCFDNTVSNGSESCTLRRIRECGSNLCSFGSRTGELRSIVECTGTRTACHLIPLTSIRSSNNGMRTVRFLKLSCAVHSNRSFLSVSANNLGCDLTTGDFRTRNRHTTHMRHIVCETSICNVSGNHTGHTRCSTCDGSNRVTSQLRTVTCGHTAKGSAHKSNRSTGAHTLTALYNSIANVTVALEFVCEPCGETACCGTGTCGSCTTEYITGTSCSVSNACHNSCRHQKLHTHTGTGLGYIEAHCRQIRVELLRGLKESQRTEQPEEYAAVSGR